MSLALEYLAAYFARPDITKSDFAKTAGMHPASITQVLQGDVQLSSKNLGMWLRGFQKDSQRIDFLRAYLADQIPPEHGHAISIVETTPRSAKAELQAQLIEAFNRLNDEYHMPVVGFVSKLSYDGDLRDLFTRTMRYLGDSVTLREHPLAAEDKPASPGLGLTAEDGLKAALEAAHLGLHPAAGKKLPTGSPSRAGKNRPAQP